MPELFAGRLLGARPAATDQVWLDVEPPAGFRDLHVAAGQFCQICLGGEEGFFAMYSAPGEAGPLRFLVRVGNPDGGECADRLASAAAQQPLEMTLPLGAGFPLGGVGPGPLCLVGTGTGIAPVRAALEVLLARGLAPAAITLDHGLRTEGHLAIGRDLARRRGLGVVVRLSYSRFEAGRLLGTTVQQALFASRGDFERVHLLAVGQDALLEDLRARFLAAGGAPERFLTNV